VLEIVKSNVMRFLDVDNDGKVSWNELLRALPLLSQYDNNKSVGRRMFGLFDFSRKGELTFDGVMRVVRDRLFIAAAILCVEIYSKLKIEKPYKKYFNDGTATLIRETVMATFEKQGGDKTAAEELWGKFTKETTQNITMDEFVDFYEANNWDVDRCSEGAIDNLRETAFDTVKAALVSSK
jgi:Ca2+-binding EF-hand superfamily protein